MKIYRLLLLFMILISLFHLSGCKRINATFLNEGSYASSYMCVSDYKDSNVEEYKRLYCNITKVDESRYNLSNDNILIKDSTLFEKDSTIFKEYYLFELYCYSDSLAQFVKLELSEIKGSISAQGRYSYYGNINSTEFNMKDERIVISIYHGDDFYIESNNKNKTINEKLYYQKYKLPNFTSKFNRIEIKGDNSGEYIGKKFSLSLTEINESEFSLNKLNQFQARYGIQHFELNLYLINEDLNTQRINLSFNKYLNDGISKHQPYFIARGYLLNNFEEECIFKIYLEMNNEALIEVYDLDYKLLYVLYFDKV